MTLLNIWTVFNYSLVLLFGLFLSVFISGGWDSIRQRTFVIASCPALLALQCLCMVFWDVQTVEKLYPVLTHLPLVLILIFILKKRPGVALSSICTSYLLCQLPNWVDKSVAWITNSPLVGEISYTASIIPFFFLLHRYFVKAAHNIMAYSRRSLLLFGSLPFTYYLFDYATTVYSDDLYIKVSSLVEFFPTVLIFFYILFLTAYHAQTQNRLQAELLSSYLNAELKQSRTEMDALHRAETQVAIYQHDMRHHLNMISGYLAENKPEQALAYIQKVEADVTAITPKHFCENEAVNLLCSSFSDRAQKLGIQLTVNVSLPKQLSVSDVELCSLLSNGLENALHAVSSPEVPAKQVLLSCTVRLNKLLIEIKNPYADEIIMENGLPASKKQGHGYGCRSIQTIAERLHGLCSFDAKHGMFTLRVVLPL